MNLGQAREQIVTMLDDPDATVTICDESIEALADRIFELARPTYWLETRTKLGSDN